MPALYQNRAENLTAKISKNNAYPAHIHRQVEIFYVLEGELSVTIREQTRILKKGDLSVTFPNLIHQTKTPVSSKALMLIFDVREFPDFQTDFTTVRKSFLCLIRTHRVRHRTAAKPTPFKRLSCGLSLLPVRYDPTGSKPFRASGSLPEHCRISGCPFPGAGQPYRTLPRSGLQQISRLACLQ